MTSTPGRRRVLLPPYAGRLLPLRDGPEETGKERPRGRARCAQSRGHDPGTPRTRRTGHPAPDILANRDYEQLGAWRDRAWQIHGLHDLLTPA
ncbi:hypothetical protein ACRAWF_30680 [Streptomyces sp. L7]